MSVVLTRRLFNGNNKPSSKNNGIVSGFDDDNDSELQQLINERKKVYQSITIFNLLCRHTKSKQYRMGSRQR